MTRIVITSAGTLGDFAPFIALGKRLQRRGRQICLAVNPSMIPLAHAAGLDAVPCGRPFGPEEARQRAVVFDHWRQPTDDEVRSHWDGLDLDRSYPELAAACRNADLLVASSLQAAAPMIHERFGVPWVSASVLPAHFPHDAVAESPPSADGRRLWLELVVRVNEVRHGLGFPPVAPPDWQTYSCSNRLLLLASSSHFSCPNFADLPQARQTGFWFEETADEFTPGDELAAFLDVSPRPLALTFSSLPVRDAAAVVRLHAEAAARLGRRLLIQGGWANLDQHAASAGLTGIRFEGALPHAWLFPRVDAVIHHGGVGTTAQALRCGTPTLVEPYGNDQFFNARRVLALGAGAALHPHKLSLDGLTRILAERVLTDAARRNAEAVGVRLRAENGLEVAAELVEVALNGNWAE